MRSGLLRGAVITALSVLALQSSAADNNEINYMPNIHGTVRTRWEMETDGGANRFQVRNARLSVDGKIAPWIDYFLNTDLCDRGKMKILDAWGRLTVAEGLTLRAGQFRMPFGVDPFRGPHQYFFANRSYIGKQVCNVRGVGAEIGYAFKNVPLNVKVSAFNPGGIADHEEWNKSMAYAGKVTYGIGNVTLATGLQSLRPDEIRVNLIDAGITWKADGWTVEGEYMNKHYTNGSHKTCHAYNFFADYSHPLRNSVFNQWSLQGRFDGMTDHSSGVRNNVGQLVTNNPARNRITVGGTLSYIKGSRHLDLRLDYEKMFFHHDITAPAGEGDKIVAEMVIRF